VSGPGGNGTCEVALAFIGMESGILIAVIDISQPKAQTCDFVIISHMSH